MLQNEEQHVSKISTTSHGQRNSYYSWFVILLCASLLFYKYVLSVSPSSMTDQLMHAFQVSGVGLGNIGAAFYYTYTIAQLFVGVILDRYSARLFAALSVAVSAVGVLLFAHAHSLSLALISRGLMGLGAAFATVTYLKMAANWFRPQQLAFVSGLLATAVMVGAICGVAPLTYLVAIVGWRSSLLCIAGLGFVVALLFLLCVRDRPSQLLTSDLVDLNQHPVSWQNVGRVISNPQNWLLTCYNGLAFVPLLVFAGLWGSPFLRSLQHISAEQSGWLVSIVFIGLGVGAPLLGLLSDRWQKRRTVMALGVILSLLAVSTVVYVPQLPYNLLVCMLFLFGFGTGAFMLVFSVSRQNNPLALAATVIAMINTGELLSAVTEPLIGKLLDLSWSGQIVNGVHYFSVTSYQYAFSLLPIYLLLALVVLYFIREPSTSNIE